MLIWKPTLTRPYCLPVPLSLCLPPPLTDFCIDFSHRILCHVLLSLLEMTSTWACLEELCLALILSTLKFSTFSL